MQRQPRRGRPHAGANAPGSRHRRCPHPAESSTIPTSRSRSTAPRRSRRAHRERCGEQRAGHAERQLPDRADVLPELQEWRQLQPRGQTPQYDIQSLQDLQNIPITGHGSKRARQSSLMSRRFPRSQEMAAVDHYNIRRVIDIYANVQGRDLGAVGRDIDEDRRRRTGICCRAAALLPSAASWRRCAPPMSICSGAWPSRSCSSTC